MNEGATAQMELTPEQARIVKSLLALFPHCGLQKLSVSELVELLDNIRLRETETHAKSWRQGWSDGWRDACEFLEPSAVVSQTQH